MAIVTLPDPIPSPETRAFWEALRENRFLVRTCCACGSAHWPPRTLCPFCFSDDTDWRASEGTGSIYSVTISGSGESRLAIAYVMLDEGVAMLSNLIAADLEIPKIGTRVRLAPTERGEYILPLFSPIEEATAEHQNA